MRLSLSSLPTSRTPNVFCAWNGASILPIPLRFGSPPRYVGHACAFSTRIVKPSEVARDTYEGVRQRTEAYR